MKTLEKPKITSKVITIKVQKTADLIKQEKAAMPKITEEIQKIEIARWRSYVEMRYRKK